MSVWRTLIRVDRYDTRYVHIVIPGWDHTKTVRLKQKAIPENILNLVKQGFVYFHAHVNIDAATQEDLKFALWEES